MSSSCEVHESRVAIFSRKLAATGALVLWLVLLAGMLGRYAWPLDLFSHFRVQYAAFFVLIAVASLVLRTRALAALCLAGALVSAIPLVGYVEVPGPEAEAGFAEFRLVSFNVWLRNADLERVATFLEHTQADAIVLQELSKRRGHELHALIAASYPYSYIDPARPGAVVFARWPITSAESIPLSSGGTRAAHVALDWRGTRVSLLGVHLHWPLGAATSRWRNRGLTQIASFAASQQGPLLVAGDLNITPWSTHFRRMLRRSGLTDCAAGQGLARSWPAQFPPLGIRIDHCLVSPHWRSVDVEVGPRLGSDHLPIVADLRLDREARGPRP